MLDKKILKQYIDAYKDLQEKEDAISTALGKINSDNQIFSLVPDHYQQAVEGLLKETLGIQNLDNLYWWIYECDYGTNRPYIWFKDTPNSTPIVLDTFDKLYDFMVEYGN